MEYYAAAVAETAAKFGRDQRLPLARLSSDYPNLLVALDVCASSPDGTPGLVIIGTLLPYWELHEEHQRAQRECQRALGHPGAQTRSPARARALCASGQLADLGGRVDDAVAPLEEAWSISRALDDTHTAALAIGRLGLVKLKRGDHAGARESLTTGLQLSESLDNPSAISRSLIYMSQLELNTGHLDASHGCLEKALKTCQEHGLLPAASSCHLNLGVVATLRGELEAATGHYLEGLHLLRRLGSDAGQAIALMNLGNIAARRGDYIEAKNRLEESLTTFRRTGNRQAVAVASINLGAIVAELGDFATAETLFKDAVRFFSSQGVRREQSIALESLGELARRQGRFAEGRAFLQRALEIQKTAQDRLVVARVLGDTAGLLTENADWMRAARLLGAGEALREEIGGRLDPKQQARFDVAVGKVRNELGDEVWERERRAGASLTVEEAIDLALEADGDSTAS